ncbi:MAG: response regulator transcription factor [Chloroflexi bacterium]|nr:response regulator transcription factor [Chloroflexota bacterium]
MTMRILVVDDEVQIVRVLRGYLEQSGYTVLTAHDGRDALRIARQDRPDLVVLDLMLPGISGLDVCRALRKESDVPIIMLTARVEETDRLVGLELGADDYVTKPFSPREVVARVRAVLRRTHPEVAAQEAEVLTAGDLRLDSARRSLEISGRRVELTPSEYEILRALMRQPGRVFQRSQLLEAAQGEAFEGYERTIDTHIKNLRRKIEPSPRRPEYILTVQGYGYKLREE